MRVAVFPIMTVLRPALDVYNEAETPAGPLPMISTSIIFTPPCAIPPVGIIYHLLIAKSTGYRCDAKKVTAAKNRTLYCGRHIIYNELISLNHRSASYDGMPYEFAAYNFGIERRDQPTAHG